MHQFSLSSDHVHKVVKDRIFSVAVHPSCEQVIVAAGDKWGKIGFWHMVRVAYYFMEAEKGLPCFHNNVCGNS